MCMDFDGHHSGGSSFIYVNDFCYYRNCLYTHRYKFGSDIRLHSLPVNLEYSLVFMVEKVNRTIQICLMDDKWARPSRFELARK